MQDKTDVAGEKTKQELIVEQQEYFDKKDRELEAQLEKERFGGEQDGDPSKVVNAMKIKEDYQINEGDGDANDMA